MEICQRNIDDQLLRPGEATDIRRRLRNLAVRNPLTTVAVCAFDRRTRMLPFYYSARRIAPAGIRAIGAAMVDSGFERTRLVMQVWNPRFSPAQARLDGQVPDLLLLSSMQIHTASCLSLIRDACRIAPSARPLIVVGGPKSIYEPWDMFAPGPGAASADVAVTGEDYVLLNLLEVLLTERAAGEPLRQTFIRVRDRGALDGVPGLMFGRTGPDGAIEELVETGTQRLLGDLDELPDPAIAYRILEPPSRLRRALASRPLAANRVRWYSTVNSTVFTSGCKMSCPYCPIPAYNQRRLRYKSPERIVSELSSLNREFGLKYFFGTDDNFFNDRDRTLAIVEKLAAAHIDGKPLRKRIRWGTEVTVHDTLRMADHLRTVRKAGAMILWLGVEDMTATFVKKGQSVDRTTEAFRLLRSNGIMAVPMLMHHDGQPFYTRNSNYGLLNQVRLLRRAGALDVQVLTMTPAVGSRIYEDAFTSRQVIESAGGRPVEQRMLDGNYVVASKEPRPWRMQMRIIGILTSLYNPLQFLRAVVRPRSSRYLIEPALQAVGMLGWAATLPKMLSWAWRLWRGKIVRRAQSPQSALPIKPITGAPASYTSACPPLPLAEGPGARVDRTYAPVPG